VTAEREARAGLTGTVGAGDRAWVERVRREGAPAVWDRLVANGRAELGRPARDLMVLERLGGRLVIPGDDEWPPCVDSLAAAVYADALPSEQLREPLALWVRGPLRLDAATVRAAAVVGSRAATQYGVDVAAEIAVGLAGRGWTTVSGAAYGIDGAAHRGALAVDGPTVAVLAGGVDVPYPRGHTDLLGRVLATGAVVSEVPPGYAPMRQRFLLRNRLISALSRGVVLVEAGWRSGALNTTAHARAVHRPVLAVPGPVHSLLSAGCHREVRERGGVLVTDAEQVVHELGAVGEQLDRRHQEAAGARDGLRADLARLLEAVPVHAAASADSIARVAGVPVRAALQALGALAAAGLVTSDAGRWRLTPLGRAPAATPTQPCPPTPAAAPRPSSAVSSAHPGAAR